MTSISRENPAGESPSACGSAGFVSAGGYGKCSADGLSAQELAELSAFIAQWEGDAWDGQIDATFELGGWVHGLLNEVRADIQAGRLGELP